MFNFSFENLIVDVRILTQEIQVTEFHMKNNIIYQMNINLMILNDVYFLNTVCSYLSITKKLNN